MKKCAGVYINTSAVSSTFRFVGWQKDGSDYSAEMGFSYTVGEEDAHFVALYAYDPASPSEPSLVLRHRLWLDCTPKGACSFNCESGGKVEEGSGSISKLMPIKVLFSGDGTAKGGN